MDDDLLKREREGGGQVCTPGGGDGSIVMDQQMPWTNSKGPSGGRTVSIFILLFVVTFVFSHK